MFKYFAFFLFILTSPLAFAGIPDGGEIKFQVLRNGNPFGVHTLNFSETAEGYTQVDIAIKMTVSAGPINFFRYEHDNKEIWDGDRLIALSAATNDNGDDYFVNANWNGDQFEIQGSAQNRLLDEPLFSTSYWHPSFLQQTDLLNTQKGNIDQIEVTAQADDMVNGRPATKYILRVNDERDISVWFDKETDQWVGLNFSIRGQNITYNRLTGL